MPYRQNHGCPELVAVFVQGDMHAALIGPIQPDSDGAPPKLIPTSHVEAIAAQTPSRALRTAAIVGIVLFVLFDIVILGLVIANPAKNSVVTVYREGALGWWAGKDIFGSGEGGFIYLPSFAVLYTPFALLGSRVGDVAWRLVSDILLAYALWSAIARFVPANQGRRWVAWGVALLLMMPSGFGALRNGQATTILMALILLGGLAILDRSWWLAAILLALSFAIKPLAIVFLLLAAVLYPRVSWRLLIAVIGFLLLPLINPDISQALHLYGLGIQKVLTAGAPDAGHWADLTGVLAKLGLLPTDREMLPVRALFAVVTLALAYVTLRRSDPVEAMLNIVGLSVVYLMVFSPRTEGNTYLMLGVVIGLQWAMAWNRADGRRATGLLAGLGMAFLAEAIDYRPFDYWYQPLLGLFVAAYLVRRCLSSNRDREPLLPQRVLPPGDAAVAVASGTGDPVL